MKLQSKKDFKMQNKFSTVPQMHKVKRIHFVGIGGSGMNGIAEV